MVVPKELLTLSVFIFLAVFHLDTEYKLRNSEGLHEISYKFYELI